MAARSSGMPSTAVYLVWPSLMALIAASLMFWGVSKSGSPAASPITSRPAAFSSRALVVIAMVGDGWMRPSDSARKPLGSGMEATLKKWRQGDNNRDGAGQAKLGQAHHSVFAGAPPVIWALTGFASDSGAISRYCPAATCARPAGKAAPAIDTSRPQPRHPKAGPRSAPTNSCPAMAALPHPNRHSRQTAWGPDRAPD